MDDAPDLSDPASVVLWHVTSTEAAEAIAAEGMRPGSYWTCDGTLADYYAECVRDEGAEPVVLQTTLDRLPMSALEPDRPGLQEPITTVLGAEEDVRARYDAALAGSGSPWQASLEALRSLRCACALPPHLLARLPDAPSP